MPNRTYSQCSVCPSYTYWLLDYVSISKVLCPVSNCWAPRLTSSLESQFFLTNISLGSDLVCHYISDPSYPRGIYGQLSIYSLMLTCSLDNTTLLISIILFSLKLWSNVNPPSSPDTVYCEIFMNLKQFTREVIVFI